jgi:hypothetical protein
VRRNPDARVGVLGNEFASMLPCVRIVTGSIAARLKGATDGSLAHVLGVARTAGADAIISADRPARVANWVFVHLRGHRGIRTSRIRPAPERLRSGLGTGVGLLVDRDQLSRGVCLEADRPVSCIRTAREASERLVMSSLLDSRKLSGRPPRSPLVTPLPPAGSGSENPRSVTRAPAFVRREALAAKRPESRFARTATTVPNSA